MSSSAVKQLHCNKIQNKSLYLLICVCSVHICYAYILAIHMHLYILRNFSFVFLPKINKLALYLIRKIIRHKLYIALRTLMFFSVILSQRLWLSQWCDFRAGPVFKKFFFYQ